MKKTTFPRCKSWNSTMNPEINNSKGGSDMNKTNKRDTKKVKKYKAYYNKPVNNFIQPLNKQKILKEKKKVKIFVTFE